MGTTEFWALGYADGVDFIAQGDQIVENLVYAVYFLQVLGVPLAWAKTYGGLRYDWIGYYQDLFRFATGLSTSRATWLAKWCKQQISVGRIVPDALRDTLGRMTFAGMAIPVIKPFLGPLYAWSSAVPSGRALDMPVAIKLTYTFSSRCLQLWRAFSHQ